MERSALCALASLLALLTAPPESAQGAVLVVDQLGGPGSQYTSIADAVAAAVDGDAILVRPGFYQPFAIDGKALVLAGDAPAGAGPTLGHTGFEHPTIKNLAAGQSVVLRGFQMSALLGSATEVEVRDCAGAVLLEDLHLSGGGPCLRVQQSAAVVLAGCTLDGQDAIAGSSFPAGAAIEAAASNLYLHECTATGGSGHDAFFPSPPAAGVDAVRVESGLCFASGTILRGGDGGDGGSALFGGCSRGADGGDGLELGAGAPAAYTLDCALQGGAGGAGYSHCLPGNSGHPLLVKSGAHTALPGTHGSLLSTSPLREGQASELQLWGPGGSLALLLLSPTAQVSFNLALSGVVVPAVGPTSVLSLGLTNLAGFLLVPFTIGSLPPGVDGSGLYLQAVFVTSSQVQLGAPSHLLQLDQSL